MVDILDNFNGELSQLKSNHTIVLESCGKIWYVTAGELALFAVTTVHENLEGKRSYLFTVTSKELLFGIEGKQEQFKLVAVALQDTQLLEIDPNQWWQAENTSEKLSLINIWLNKIAVFLEGKLPEPQQQPKPLNFQEEQISLHLKPGEIIQASNLPVWVEIQQGNLNLLGLEEILVNSSWGVFPLHIQQWMQGKEDVDLILYQNPALIEPQLVQQGLVHYHQTLLIYINHIQEQEKEKNRQKLQQKLDLDQQTFAGSLKQLASIFERKPVDLTTNEQTPLLRAMGKIGRYMGVEIKPPAQSEDLTRFKNPLEGIIRASRLQIRRVVLSGDWWQKDNGALLTYRQDQTPLALIPVKRKGYALYDPLTNTSTPVSEASLQNLSPIAFMFYRTFPEKSMGVFDVLKFALHDRLGDLFLILVCALSATLLNMLSPILIGKLVNDVIPDAETDLLLQMGGVLIASTIGVSLFKLTQSFTLLRLETAADAPTQAALWDRVLQLKAQFFRNYSSGDLQSRISGITSIRRQLSGSTLNILLSSVFAFLNLGLMLYYSLDIAILGLIIALISIIITTIHSFFIIKQNRKLLNIEGELFGKVVQLVNSVPKLRVAGALKRAFAYWAKDYRERTKIQLKVQLISNSLSLFNQIISPLSTICLFWLAYTAMKPTTPFTPPKLSVGDFMAANAAFGTFISSTTSLSQTLMSSLDVVNLWQRSQPILTAPLEVDYSKIDPGRLRGKISVEQVTFRYRTDKPPILNNVSLAANPGEFIALVGATGSGKSTLLRLLLGFETPEAGVIYYDDQDLSQLNIQAVRRQLGVVLQTSRLQAASIFDNIAGGSLITLNEAWEAATRAGFADDVKNMPMGMNTVVSEGGSNLSGGQRQRLLIAKALVLKPKIILFDEATSALDNNTQAIVTKSLDELNVTRIVIAHRLSTIRSANRIYVLDQGKIIQQGSFDDLASQEGLFAHLVARQML